MGNIDEGSESKRTQIITFITEHPGAHLRKIKRELNLAMGVIQYHLYTLEKERKDNRPQTRILQAILPHPTVRGQGARNHGRACPKNGETSLLFLMQNPTATQKELSGFARVSPSTINWHMQRLTKAKLIKTTREGATVRYLVKVNRSEIITLLKNYHPTVWERWADRLADILE